MQFDVRPALACRSFDDKLKFAEHLFQTALVPAGEKVFDSATPDRINVSALSLAKACNRFGPRHVIRVLIVSSRQFAS